MTTTVTKVRLTTAQRAAMDDMEHNGSARERMTFTNDYGGHARRVLDALVEKGLAEWYAADRLSVSPRIVPVGTNAREAKAREAEAARVAQERADLIARLAADPAALAEYVVDMESRLNARIGGHHHSANGAVR